MKLLANENFPLSSVKLLRDRGYDIEAISETCPGISDRMVLLKACEEQRIIITFDRDYGELIYKYSEFALLGIIYLRFVPVTPIAAGEYVFDLLQNKDIQLKQKFTVCEPGRIRQNSLILAEA